MRTRTTKRRNIGILVGILAGIAVFLTILNSFAESPEEPSSEADPVQAVQEEEWELSPKEPHTFPVIDADGAISLFVDEAEKEYVLFEQSAQEPLPVASVTKLMTSYVALANYDLDREIEITQLAAELPGRGKGKLKIGERFLLEDLLLPVLVESNNTAALALTNPVGEKEFVRLMNAQADLLGMDTTRFVNPTGLDKEEEFNLSSAQDLARFASFLLREAPVLFEISRMKEVHLYDQEGIHHGNFINTNELLEEYPSIVGGKTGWTPRQKESLLVVLEAPHERGYIINVILGTSSRFEEMRKLIEYATSQYEWE